MSNIQRDYTWDVQKYAMTGRIVQKNGRRWIQKEMEDTGNKYSSINIDLWWDIAKIEGLATYLVHRTCRLSTCVEGYFNHVRRTDPIYACEGCGHLVPPEVQAAYKLCRM